MSVNLGSAHGKIVLDASGVREGLKAASGALHSFQGVATAALGVVGIGAAAAAGAMVKSSIDMNASLETTTLQFETLMGSAEKAEAHVASLFEIAKKTPFETGPIIEASRMLQTFGGEALNTEENIIMIGDAAAAVSAPINELGFWIGRLYSNVQGGQPFGEAAMRLQELAVMSPKARQEMERLQKAGASADEVFAVFTADLERYRGAMERQAGTWSGLMSTITDSVKLALAEGLRPFFEGAKVGLEQVVVVLNDPALQEGIQKFAVNLGEMMAKLLPLVVEHGPALAKLLAVLVAGFGGLVVVAKVVGLFTTLAPVASGLAAALGLTATATTAAGVAATGAAAGTGVLGGALAALTGPIGLVIAAAGLLAVAWAKDWGGIREKTAAAIDYIKGLIKPALDAIRAWWEEHGAGILRFVSNLWEAIKTPFRVGFENLKGLLKIFGAAFQGDWEEVGRQLRLIWERTVDALEEIFSHLWEAVGPALEALGRKIIEWWEAIDWRAMARWAADELAAGLAEGEFDPGQTMIDSLTRSNPAAWLVRKVIESVPDFQAAGARMARGMVAGWEEEAERGSGSWADWAANEAEAIAERQAAAAQAAAESADRAMLHFAENNEIVTSAVAGTNKAISETALKLVMTRDRMKEAGGATGKLGGGLDALTAAALRNQAALDAAKAAAEQYAAAFANVQADYTTELPQEDEPLVTPEQDVTIRTRISGPTAEQAALAAKYNDELKKLRETYTELTGGIGTFGMEQGKLDEKIAETAGEIAHYEGLLAGIPPAVDDVSTSHQGLKVNVESVHRAIYDQLVQIGAAPEVITAYAAATGIMTDAQAKAALQAAAVQVKIEELAQKMAEGLPIDAALADLDAFISKIEQGVDPAATTLTTDIPQRVVDMKDQMAEDAHAAGAGVPTGIDAGIRENLDLATTAATDAATAVTDAVNEAFGSQSPSTVAAGIGGDFIAGLTQGLEENRDEPVGLAVEIGGDVVDAWDETIEAADGIGVAIMDGVIAGVESRRGALIEKMKEIARAAYQAAMDEIQATSPSKLFMQMGRAIIQGVVAGLDAEKDTLYGRLADIAETLHGIGMSVFGRRGEGLAADVEDANEEIERFIAALPGSWAEHIRDAMRTAAPDELPEMLRGLVANLQIGRMDPQAEAEWEAFIELAERRNKLEEEYTRQQEELARLEEQRSKLDFLNTQIELLDLIRENGLSTNILDGLKLGLDANMDDIIAAMTAAVGELVDRTNEELGIASPSTVFQEIGRRVMQGFARGLEWTAGVERQLKDAMKRTVDLGISDARSLEGRLGKALSGAIRVDAQGLNPAQTVNIYGGYNVALEGTASTDPLRALYFQSLGYQGG